MIKEQNLNDDFVYNNEEEAEMGQLHAIHNNMNAIANVRRALEAQAAQVQWAKERNAAQQRDQARAQFKVTARQREKQRAQELEEMYKEDLRLREKWEDVKPMVSDTAWVQHVKTENPEMYQELRNVVTYIWGYNANKVWEMYAEKEKRYERRRR